MIAPWLFVLHLAALPVEPWGCGGQDSDVIRDEVVTLPFERTLRARADRVAVLMVEERGEPLQLWLAEGGAPARLLDLPPDGRAFEVVVVEPAGVVDLRLQSGGGASEAPVRLRLSCNVPSTAAELTALRALQSASTLLARAESDAEKSEALRIRAIDELQIVWSSAPSTNWPWLRAAALHGSAFLHGRRNEPQKAANQYVEAAQAWLDLDDSQRAAWALLREAQQLRRVSQFTRALEVVERAQALASDGADVGLQLAVSTDACLLRRLAHSAEGARDCWRDLLPLATRHARPGELATLMANYADVQIILGEFESAESLAQRAVEQARHSDARRSLLLALVVLGRIHGLQARVQEALAHFAEARELAGALNDLPMLANSALQLARIWTLLDQPRRASAAAIEARDAYTRLGDAARSAHAALMVATLRGSAERATRATLPGPVVVRLVRDLPLQGEYPLAVRLLAVDVCLTQGDVACSKQLLAPFDEAKGEMPYAHARALGLASARLALLEGDAEAAIDVARLWHERAQQARDLPTQLDTLWIRGQAEIRSGRNKDAYGTLQELLDGALYLGQMQTYPFHRQQLLERARAAFALQLSLRPPADDVPLARSELPFLLQLLASTRPPDAVPTARAQAAQARLNRMMQLHWQLDLGATAGSMPDPLLASTASLPFNSALASRGSIQPTRGVWYGFLSEDRLHWWQLRGDRVLHRLSKAPRAKLLELQDALLRQLRMPRSDLAEIERLASELSDASGISGLAGSDHDAERLQVVLPDALASLPLPFLLTSDSDGTQSLLVVVLEPVAGGDRPAPCCVGQQLLAVADPAPTLSSGTKLPRLPGARDEAQRVASIWPPASQRLLLGADVGAEHVLQGLASSTTVVHLGTHGLARRDDLELSGLLTVGGDGSLRSLGAVELMSSRLASPLVILSACDGGLPLEISATTSTSLARVLLRAGVSRVIASSWQVDDMAAAELMSELHRSLVRGDSPEFALQAAQAAIRAQRRYAHPYYWAGFQLVEASRVEMGSRSDSRNAKVSQQVGNQVDATAR